MKTAVSLPLVSCVLFAAAMPCAPVRGDEGKPQKPEVKPAKKSVEERVREIVVEQLVLDELGVKKEAVTLKARLREDLKADSLDMLEMVLEWEKEFEVSIPDEVVEKFVTVGDVVTYLKKVVK